MDFDIEQPEFFLITGTGRCGTMLLAHLLSQADDAVCEHEACFHHQSMIDYGVRGVSSGYDADIHQRLIPKIESARRDGKLYGVSSGHAYYGLDRLYERFGTRARFVLMVREPSEFARSALARGFFDPDHPHYCEQTPPPPTDPIAARWESVSPFEKCLWYWRRVNDHAISVFDRLPAGICRVLRMEDLSTPTVVSLCGFLGIRGLSETRIAAKLAKPINVSPTGEHSEHINPYSHSKTLPGLDHWPAKWVELLLHYTEPLRSRLYGPLPSRPVASRVSQTARVDRAVSNGA